MSTRTFRDVLSNGLRVVTIEAPHLHSAMVTVYVRLGSRHETRENNGVSHFLEHLFFRGSHGHPDPVRMNALIEEAGGNLNGVTGRDYGYYYTPIHPAYAATAIEVLGDMLTRPLLTGLEVERQIILEEMLDEVDERGRDIDVDNLSKEQLFAAHPLALKIAGTTRSVKQMTQEKVENHFREHYVAQNLVLCVAGQVRRKQVVAAGERAFRHLRRGRRTQETAPPRPPSGPMLRFVQHDEAQTVFRLSFPTVPESHADYPALALLRRVLDDGLSSRLPHEVVERRGLAYGVHAAMETFADTGLFEIESACAPENASRVLVTVLELLGELCEHGPTIDELARAQRREHISLDFAQDSPGDLCGWFGAGELFRRAETFEQRLRRINSQTADKLIAVARRYFIRKHLTVTAVGQRAGHRALERAVTKAAGLRH